MQIEAKSAKVFVTITPSDATPLPQPIDALYVGTGGNVTLVDQEGNEAAFLNVISGSTLPVSPTFVKATGLSADDFIGLSYR